MRTYTITKVTDQPDWESIPALEITESYRRALEDTPVRAWTQVAYNDEALLIRQRALEPVLRKELTGLLDEICEDSCLEFFLCPMEGDLRYFNIEHNPNCCRYLGFGSGIDDLIRLIPEEDNDGFCTRVTEFDGGWELTFQIPYHFIRRFFPDFKAEPGKVVRANCYKCGGKTENPHSISWNRVSMEPRCFFHQPKAFGRMIFG